MIIAITHPDAWRRRVIAAAAVGLLALTGCGAGGYGNAGDGGNQPGSAAASGSAGTTVTVSNDVLVNASGRALYVSDEENGSVLCKSSDCTKIWIPLTVPAGQKPTGPTEVTSRLGTISRPDGAAQVALDDKPLYTFSFDHGAGQIGGEGEKDSFDGTDFTWHAAKVSGGAEASASGSSSGDGGGGY